MRAKEQAAQAISLDVEAIRRSTDLNALENIVKRNVYSAIEAAEALLRIHSAGLYKLTHSSWESYCRYLSMSPQRAHQLMDFAKVINQVDVPVPTERHARELARVPEDKRNEVMQEAMDLSGGQPPTTKTLREVVDDLVGKAKSPSIQTRRTPKWLFDELNARFGPFVLDAFADPHNAMCPKFYTRENNGCMLEWADVTFGNPEFADMAGPLEQAVRQAEKGHRSVIVGPVGCSQGWYHQLAIRGTVYVPDMRICYDTPDGKPTGVSKCHNGLSTDECRRACKCVNGADRDTIVMTFGGEHANPNWKAGEFRVRRLELDGPR